MNPAAPHPAPRLNPGLAQELHRPAPGAHWVRLGFFVILYGAGAWGAWWLAGMAVYQPVAWVGVVLCWILAASSLHGISLFTHEAVHGTLSRNKVVNALLGAACAAPVLQNCTAYKVLHLRHHAHLGEGDDPDHYASYTRWSWLIFCMNWLRLLVGYPIYITAIPILGCKHGTWKDRWGILAEMLGTATLFVALWQLPVPSGFWWHAWLMPLVAINFMVNVRGMSQHTLLPDCDDEVRGTRSILTSRLVAFFMCNENYHLEHHLYPGVPWYNLPEVHAALGPELRHMGAPYIGSYSSFVRDFVVHSIKRGPWRHPDKS